MFKKQQCIAIACSLALILVLSACGPAASPDSGASTDDSATTSDAVSQAAPAEGGEIQFSYLMPTKHLNWLRDLLWYPEFEKAVGAKVDFVDGGDGDVYNSGVDLKLASREFPDAGVVKLAQSKVYGAQGAFMDLAPLIKEHAPHIQQFIDNNPDYRALIQNEDGTIYGLLAETPKISSVTMYREEHLEAAGVEPPQTISEFTEVLRQLRQTYADNPNYYPFSGQEDLLVYADAFQANDFIDDSGKVHGIYTQGNGYDIHSPGYREMIEWFKMLYDEKLVDPEWVTGAITEIVWETKMMTGQATFADNWFTYPTYFMVNADDPDVHFNVIPYFKDEEGNQLQRASTARFHPDRAFVINAQAENAEDIIRYMDFVFSPEGQTIRSYGIEGKTYEVVDGVKNFLIKFEEEWPKPVGVPNAGFFQDRLTFPGPVDNDGFYRYLDDFTASYAKDYFDKTVSYPALPYTVEQAEERSNLLAQVSEAQRSNEVKFITGQRPMSEFDAYLAEMDALGYQEIVAIDQAASDSTE